jgi:predicted Zn-dependent protease
LSRTLRWVAVALACSSCVFVQRDKPGLSESIEREKALTADIHHQIRDHAPLVSDPVVLEFVYEVGERIVAVTEPQPFIYRFFIIEDDSLNAFTIGGGYIYIHTGTLAQVGDVSELAGLLAHEIAHVRKRHIARRGEGQNVATLTTLASLAAVALGADPGVIIVAQGLNVSLQLKHTRANEAESDREGVGYMIKAGYDPYGMQRFFQRIHGAYPSHGNEIPTYLFSHPAIKERIASIPVLVERNGGGAGLQRENPRLREIQARLARLSEPVVGGSGLKARAQFDRDLTDPLLARASDTQTDERALDLLGQAELLEPNDPRIFLQRAEIHTRHENLEAARADLERAFELDPSTPVVAQSLGRLHKKLDNRSRAVFYMELAIANYRPGSSKRKAAELEIERLEFPLLESSAFSLLGQLEDEIEDPHTEGARFAQGDSIVWTGSISERFEKRTPPIEVSWRSPSGEIVLHEKVEPRRKHRVTSTFDSTDAELGRWTLEVAVGESREEELWFELVELDSQRRGA